MSAISRIAVVGSINMDCVLKVPRLPVSGETLIGEEYQLFPGGKGANQAVGAVRLGAEVAMIGCVGDDPAGSQLREGLANEGVSTTHVRSVAGMTSGMAMITLTGTGQNTIVLAPGANMHVSREQVNAAREILESCDVLLLQLEIPVEIVELSAGIAGNGPCRVILNPAPARDIGSEVLELADYLVPNEVEAAILTGHEVKDETSAERAARVLQNMSNGAVIAMTLGGRGALLLGNEKRPVWVPAPTVDVVDTTAAGDAFVAGMAVALAEGGLDAEAVRWGCAAGALAVTKLGAQPSLPTREDIQKLLVRSPAS